MVSEKQRVVSAPKGPASLPDLEFLVKVLATQSCLTVTHQALLSMGFSRQGCWSGLPFPSPGDLPNPGIKPRPPALQADSLPFEP